MTILQPNGREPSKHPAMNKARVVQVIRMLSFEFFANRNGVLRCTLTAIIWFLNFQDSRIDENFVEISRFCIRLVIYFKLVWGQAFKYFKIPASLRLSIYARDFIYLFNCINTFQKIKNIYWNFCFRIDICLS